MLNFNIEEEISEVYWNKQGDQEDLPHEEADPSGAATKSSRKLPEVWTRIISVYGDDLSKVKPHKTATDLLIVAGYESFPAEKDEEDWKVLFSPKEFAS